MSDKLKEAVFRSKASQVVRDLEVARDNAPNEYERRRYETLARLARKCRDTYLRRASA